MQDLASYHFSITTLIVTFCLALGFEVNMKLKFFGCKLITINVSGLDGVLVRRKSFCFLSLISDGVFKPVKHDKCKPLIKIILRYFFLLIHFCIALPPFESSLHSGNTIL